MTGISITAIIATALTVGALVLVFRSSRFRLWMEWALNLIVIVIIAASVLALTGIGLWLVYLLWVRLLG